MRQFLLAAMLIGFLCLAVGSAEKPAPVPVPAAPAAAGGQKIAVFNMVAVMKEYKKAKYKVWELAEEKRKLSEGVTQLKAEYQKLQQELQAQQNPALKDKIQERMLPLARKIEDKSRRIDKSLNQEAIEVIVDLYDEIKLVVTKLAEDRGYDIVFAYPDAATPEEAKTPYMKELKLKPPAAQPFYVDKRIELTEAVITELNTRNPSPDPPPPGAPAPGKDEDK